jgi:hypothetical protein
VTIGPDHLFAHGAQPPHAAARLPTLGGPGRSRLARAWPLAAALLVGGGSVARAQAPPASAAGGNPLTVSVAALSVLESVPAEQGLAPPEQGRLKVGVGYGRSTRRSSVDLSMSSIVPYATNVQTDRVSYAGAVRFSTRFGRRIELEVVESISERPLDGTGLWGYSPAAPGAFSDALTTNASLGAARETRNDGEITLSRTFSRRSSVALSYQHTTARSVGLDTAGSQVVALRLERRISPSGVFHAGYGFGTASFATAEAAAGVRHDFDVGFDYARPLPFSGRTMFAAETGSTLLSDGRTQRLRLVARGSLSRELAARWSTRFEYSRPMQFVAGFRQPFLSDALGVNVDGQLGRSWFLSMAAGAARGSVGLRTQAPQYDSYTTSVRVHRQLGRAWRAEVEGFSTRFRFNGSGSSDVALPARLARQGIRAGVSWSAAFRRR